MEFGLIGEKLSHSFSPKIHSHLATYDYRLVELEREKLQEFIQNKEYKGLNVTIPYKKSVIPMLDEISDIARRIGAVNTIVNKNGKLFGDNTDYYGFCYMLSYGKIAVQNKTVAVLGTGGASNMAVQALKDLGAKEVLIVSRTGEIDYARLKTRKDVEIIVNATPVGTYPMVTDCAVDLNDFPSLSGVVDLVYNPSVTELIYRAKQKGVACVNGLSMLVAQAKRACELFTDIVICDDKIKEIISAIERETKNVTLIGMPGSGKTTVGKLLAKITGRELIDTDALFYSRQGKTAGDYIKEFGETAFRDAESEIVKLACAESGKIIATGGGVVKREDNRKYLKMNSFCVWIQRDISLLATKNRPLSNTPEKVQALYAERAPLYKATCDFSVKTEFDAKETAIEIARKLGL